MKLYAIFDIASLTSCLLAICYLINGIIITGGIMILFAIIFYGISLSEYKC